MPTPISDEFEKAFSDLAFAYINNNAPKLFDHMVGFQIVENNEDDTKALGVFGFKIGKEWYYAPVFFLNGDLKGQELLYAKTSKLFLPMEEAWIDYIINKKPLIAGQNTTNSIGLLGSYLPNFSNITQSPIHKRAYATEFDGSGEIYANTTIGERFDLRPVEGMWAELNNLHKQACENLSLSKVLKNDPQLRDVLAHRAHYYPKFAKALTKFYQPEDLIDTTNLVVAKEAKVATEQFQCKAAAKKEANTKVSFLTSMDDLYQPGVSSELKEEYLKRGFAVNDLRTQTEKSAMYDNNIKITNPTESGYYQVITMDGSLVQCYISPIDDEYSKTPQIIVIPCPDRYHSFQESNLNVVVLDSYFEKTDGPLVKKNLTNKMIEELGSWPRKYHYFLLNDNGDVCKIVAHDRDAVVSDKIQSIKNINHTTMVPKGKKCLQKKQMEGAKKLLLGDWDTINNIDMTKVATEVTLKNVGGSQYRSLVGCDVRNLSGKVATTRFLVQEVGLDKADANLLVSEANEKKSATYFVKLAYPYAVDQYDPQAPFMSTPDVTGYDPAWAQQTSNDEVVEQPVMGLPQNPMGDYGELDPETLQSMTQSADQNQKEVFDTTALSSLLNTNDVSNMIDKYLKDLIVAIDRIGRILFMMYYHYDTYQDRYGSDELFELEDALKNSFKTTGKLVLFLKQRSIVSDVDDRQINLDDVGNNS
jgi:hypothetical protein